MRMKTASTFPKACRKDDPLTVSESAIDERNGRREKERERGFGRVFR